MLIRELKDYFSEETVRYIKIYSKEEWKKARNTEEFKESLKKRNEVNREKYDESLHYLGKGIIEVFEELNDYSYFKELTDRKLKEKKFLEPGYVGTFYRLQCKEFDFNHKSFNGGNERYTYEDAFKRALECGYLQKICKRLNIECIPDNVYMVRNHIRETGEYIYMNRYIFVESGLSCFENLSELKEYIEGCWDKEFWLKNKYVYKIKGQYLSYGEDDECIIKPIEILDIMPTDVLEIEY